MLFIKEKVTITKFKPICKTNLPFFLIFKLCQVVKQVELHHVAKFHQNRTRNKLFTVITKILQKTLKGSNFATKLNFQKIIAPQVVILNALNVV